MALIDKLGNYIERLDRPNSDLRYGIDDVCGITNTKQLVLGTKANLIGRTFEKFSILAPREFIFNRRTSRNGEHISLGYNTTNREWILTEDYCHFRVQKNKEDVLDPDYLYLFFLDPEFDRYARFNSWGSATEFFNWEEIIETPVPILPIEEQRKIVSDYQIITKRIKLLQIINEKLTDAGTYLFNSFFINNKDQYTNVSLYDIADYINGTSFTEDEYTDTGIPIIKIAELKDGITTATQYFTGRKEDKYFIKDSDVLFSWSGNPETSIDAFIRTHGKGILNQHTFKMVCTHGKAFTFFMLKHCKPEFVKAAQGKQTTGLGHVTVQDLKRLTIPFNEEKAKDFNEKGMPFFDNIFRNLKEINLLNDMINHLLVSLSRAKGA